MSRKGQSVDHNCQNVIKSSGELEHFSIGKLQRSVRRSGLPPKFCKQVTSEVLEKLHPDIKTKDIFNHTVRIIKKKSPVAATRYSLKNAIFDLGPSGFEFEKFVARYFSVIGFKTQIGKLVQGKFVRHEVDIVASKDGAQVFVECKFHNRPAKKNDIKIALYVKARWDDLKDGPEGRQLREYYLVSNTTFTKDAIDYSNGTGLKLLGVNAPVDESFLDKVKRYNLYPITSLKRLKKASVEELIKNNIILCSELLQAAGKLREMKYSEEEIKAIFKDINEIMIGQI